MANVLNTNPLVIDTSFNTKYSAQSGALTIPPGGFFLDEIYWYNPTASGDTFVVTLGDGNTIIRCGRAEAASQSQLFKMYGMRVTDFQVPTLTSGGKLYIYFH